MSDLPHLQVIHEPEFDEQLFALIGDPERAEEYIAGAKYTLAKWPDSGMAVSKTGKTWYLPMSPVHGRRVSLYYTFDEETVSLLWIQAFDE
jgi:hypothetical protein